MCVSFHFFNILTPVVLVHSNKVYKIFYQVLKYITGKFIQIIIS